MWLRRGFLMCLGTIFRERRSLLLDSPHCRAWLSPWMQNLGTQQTDYTRPFYIKNLSFQGLWCLQGGKILEPVPRRHQGVTVPLEKVTSYSCCFPWKIIVTIFRRKAGEIFQTITIRKFIFQGRYNDWKSSLLSRKENLVFLSIFLVCFILVTIWQWFLQFRYMKKKISLFFDIDFFKQCEIVCSLKNKTAL